MKKKSIHNYLLFACVVVLGIITFVSVSSPLRFNREREKREEAVKSRLLQIRKASETFMKANGRYASKLEEMVGAGYLADSLRLVPYGEGEVFSYSASILSSKTDRSVPVMECSAEYSQYLKGMDEGQVLELINNAIDKGEFPGLKIGDLEHDNHNAGNWD